MLKASLKRWVFSLFLKTLVLEMVRSSAESSMKLGRRTRKPALRTWCVAEVWCNCLSQRERERRPERIALEEVSCRVRMPGYPGPATPLHSMSFKFNVVEHLAVGFSANCSHSVSFKIIIIVWLVRCRTLPFLRACSRLDDSALDDRRLPDQCWMVLDRIQRPRTRCNAVGPHRRFQSLGKDATHNCSTVVTDGSARAVWPKNLRRVVRMMCEWRHHTTTVVDAFDLYDEQLHVQSVMCKTLLSTLCQFSHANN